MAKIPNKNKGNKKYKAVKLDTDTHRLLRIYAAKKGFLLSEAVRNLVNKTTHQ